MEAVGKVHRSGFEASEGERQDSEGEHEVVARRHILFLSESVRIC
jgi:hypothetical protein